MAIQKLICWFSFVNFFVPFVAKEIGDGISS